MSVPLVKTCAMKMLHAVIMMEVTTVNAKVALVEMVAIVQVS